LDHQNALLGGSDADAISQQLLAFFEVADVIFTTSKVSTLHVGRPLSDRCSPDGAMKHCMCAKHYADGRPSTQTPPQVACGGRWGTLI